MRIRLVGFLTVVASAFALAACGGGGGNLVVIPTATPASTTAPVAPTTQQTQSPVTTSGGTLNLGPVSNGTSTTISSASVTLPALSAAGTVTAQLTASLPAGVPVPNAVKRRNTLGVSNTPLAYIGILFGQNETISSSPAISVTLKSQPPAGNAYLAIYTPASGWTAVAGPVTITGTTIAFTAASVAPPLTLLANQIYIFAVVDTGSATLPTPQPTLNPAATASYAGTKTIAFAYNYAFGYPAPSSPQPPTSTTYSVVSTVSVGTSPIPGSQTGALDEHTTETDTSNLSSATYATDAWVGNGAAGATADAVLLYAQTQTEPSSANAPSMTTTYATPQILDEFPETSGASWSNSPASTNTYTYASGNSGTRTMLSNGTYTDIENSGNAAGGGGVTTMQENNDGSGSISAPNVYVQAMTFSAPSPVPSASPNVNITISYTPYGASLFETSGVVLQDPVWYSTPPAFYNETDTVKTNANMPSNCQNSYGTSGNDITRTINTLDTIVGFEETTQFDTYVAGGLPVCMVSTDTLTYAYLTQGQTPALIVYGPLGLATQTTTETLVLQSGATGPLPTDRRAISALQAHQLSVFARTRSERRRALLESARNAQLGGRL